jgi:hypothetical protein
LSYWPAGISSAQHGTWSIQVVWWIHQWTNDWRS